MATTTTKKTETPKYFSGGIAASSSQRAGSEARTAAYESSGGKATLSQLQKAGNTAQRSYEAKNNLTPSTISEIDYNAPTDTSKLGGSTFDTTGSNVDTKDYTSEITAGNIGLNAGYTPPTTETKETKTTAMDDMKEYLGMFKPPKDTANDYLQAEKDAGIAAKQQQVNDLSAQLAQITAKAQADQLRVTGQGRGIPEVIIGGQQAQIAKEAAIQALPIQAQLAAAQGNLEYAQNRLDTLFKLKTDDANRRYEFETAQIERAYNYADKKEQRALDAAKEERGYAHDIEMEEIRQAHDIEMKKIGLGGDSTGDAQIWATAIKNGTAKLSDVPDTLKASVLSLSNIPSGDEITEAKGVQGISTINSLMNNDIGINASSGMFQRYSLVNENKVKDWRADMSNVLAGLTTAELARIKGTGVTFGALSDGERELVAAAASALNNAAEKDENGRLTGRFNVSEAKVREQLGIIKKYAEIDFKKRTGRSYEDYVKSTVLNNDDLNEIDKAYGINTSTESFNPANFY